MEVFVKTLEGSLMRTTSSRAVRAFVISVVSLLAAAAIAVAQETQSEPSGEAPPQQSAQPHGTWRRFSGSSNRSVPPSSASNPTNSTAGQGQEADPSQTANQPDGQGNYGVPPRLVIQPGTFATVRVNQMLSSDRNQAGDAFSGMLERPLIVDGVVVAQRGQTVGGRVAEAEKAGRVKGVSRLGLELTDLTLADGQQLPVRSALLGGTGGKSIGRDVSAIAGTTAVGAAVGAAADWGTGAAIGAGAGAAAATLGVLLTRGRPTVIYPESVLTFRIEAPVNVSTERAPQAFRFVEPGDYNQPQEKREPPPSPRLSYCGPYGCPPPPPPYYSYWPGYYYPYYGPGVSFFFGPRFTYGRRYGFHR